jgi:CubicO group peptidase (beta-lactamase class C family)
VEIGSCTKVFTTALFAEAIGAGRMAPGDSIQRYMPSGVQLQPAAQAVTLLELADFSSGMPDDPPDLPRRLEERSIEHYTTEDLFEFVQNWAPAEPLPAPYEYSNAGIGLLGYLVADALGAPWRDLLEARITGPLQMSDTMMEVDGARRGRLAQGHRPDGAPAPEWPVFAWYAAGVLRSTAEDMLSLGEAALGHATVDGEPVPPELLAALQLATRPIYQPEGRPFEQAMAWAVHPGDPQQGTHTIIVKDGGTDGFNSVIAINPSKDLAVFVAANQSRSGIPDAGIRIVREIP